MSVPPAPPAAFPFFEPSQLMDCFRSSIGESGSDPIRWQRFLQATLAEASEQAEGAPLTPLNRVFLYTLTEVALRSDRADGVEPILTEYRRIHPDDFLLEFLSAKIHNALERDPAATESLVGSILSHRPTGDDVPFEWLPPRPAQAPLVSIAISTWNRLASLKATLASIRAHTTLPYEVIVYDNHSSDGSAGHLQSLRSAWPELGLLLSAGHRYNVPAFNLAFSLCRGRLVGPICDDVIVLPGWDTALAEELTRDPRIGAAHPLVLNSDGTVFLYEGGLPQTSRLHPWISEKDPAPAVEGKSPEAAGLSDGSRRIAAGIYPFVRRDLIGAIRMFDPRFLHHWADYDLCLQIRRLGFEIRLAPAGRVMDTRQPHHCNSPQSALLPSEIADLFYNPSRVLPRLQTPPSPFWRLQRDRLLFECKWSSFDPNDPL